MWLSVTHDILLKTSCKFSNIYSNFEYKPSMFVLFLQIIIIFQKIGKQFINLLLISDLKILSDRFVIKGDKIHCPKDIIILFQCKIIYFEIHSHIFQKNLVLFSKIVSINESLSLLFISGFAKLQDN